MVRHTQPLAVLLPALSVLDSVSCNAASASFNTKDVGNKIVTATGITLSGTDAGNYGLINDTATTTANITQASATTTAKDAIKTYGQTLIFNGTEFTVIGMLDGDNVSSVTLTHAGAASTSPVGSCICSK